MKMNKKSNREKGKRKDLEKRQEFGIEDREERCKFGYNFAILSYQLTMGI